VGIPHRLRCHPPFGDPPCSIRGGDVQWLTYSVGSVFLCFVCKALRLLVPVDAQVTRDPVDCSFDAVEVEGPCLLVDCSFLMLPWSWVQLCCLSDGHQRITRHCHCYDSVCSISNNSIFCQKHPGVENGSDSSD